MTRKRERERRMRRKREERETSELSFRSLVAGVRLRNNEAIRQFRELLLVEWMSTEKFTVRRSISDFVRMARPQKESEATRLLNQIVRCNTTTKIDPELVRQFKRVHSNKSQAVCVVNQIVHPNTTDLVVMDHELSQQFKDLYSKEFTSLGLVLAGVWSDQTDLQLLATKKFRTLLLGECPVVGSFIIKCDVVPRFEWFLVREDSPDLQTEAALALLDISFLAKLFVAALDTVKILLKLLDSPSADIREKAVIELGMVAKSSEGRDLVHQHEAVCPLLDKVLRPSLNEWDENVKLHKLDENAKLLPTLRNATYALLRFCKAEEEPGVFEVEVTQNEHCHTTVCTPAGLKSKGPHLDKVRTALPELFCLVKLTDKEVLTNACSALARLTERTYCKTPVIIGDDVCRRLVELLEHESPSVVSPALRTLGNIALRDVIQSQHTVDFVALPCLWKLLSKNVEDLDVWRTIRSLNKGNNRCIKAAQTKSTNSQSLEYELQESKMEVKRKLDKYERLGKRSKHIQGSLLNFCYELGICVPRSRATKEDMVLKLMEFLEGHHATRFELFPGCDIISCDCSVCS